MKVRNILLPIFVCSIFFGQQLFAQNKDDKTILSIERNQTDNTPVSVSFSASAKWNPAQAQDIFKRYLGIDGINTTMEQVYSTTTKMNVTTDRYAEYYKGIKVAYGSFTLMSKNGMVNFMSGNYYPFDAATSSVPAITENTAFTNALKYVGAEKYRWEDSLEEAHIKALYHNSDTSYLPKGKLEWIEDYNGGANDRKLHLAWSFNIYASQPLSRQTVYIDASTGKVLYSNSEIRHTAASGHTLYSGVVPFQTAHVGGSYRLYDSTRGNGVHTLNMNNGTNYGAATELTSTGNTWPSSAADTTALDAHWGAEMVYDYWKTQQGRLSWDNANGILLQYVHYDNNYDNAYWDGTEMTYGDGSGCAAGGFTSLTSLDVTGHEIGHGVCQSTANLVYSGESGGMNEGFSDCWGATIENWANPHETDAVPKQPWKIGEEIGCGNPLRSMDAPKLQGQPDTYLGVNWVTVAGCTPNAGNDQCGVHTNSGVLNHWYYLVTIGGTGTNDNGNGFNVNGIGWSEAANILYQTELVLPSNATYAVCRTNSINVATTLYGPCSPEVQCVTNAWYAVGVGSYFVPCVPQIGFSNTSLTVTEYAATTACPASKVINIGMKPFGPAITGGNPSATIVIAGGTAISGVDYSLGTTTLTWTAGDTTTHYTTMTIYDNGAVYDNKTLKLGYTLAAAGSNATRSPTNDTMQILIANNDSIPLTGGNEYHTIDYNNVTSNLTSPFYSTAIRAHTQYIISAAELLSYGLRPNAPISQIGFTVITKNSTRAFSNYNISMANTTATDLSTAFVTAGMVNVYSGTYTTFVGLDTLDFNTGAFTWDGTSNVCVEICFLNTAVGLGNDQVAGYQGGGTICDHNQALTGTTLGCTLGYSAANQSDAKPVMRFKQNVPPTGIATATGSARSWNVHAGQEVYFYNPADSKLIAGLKNISNDLGCVTAAVTQQGNGFTPASFASCNRSRKEFSITPTINGSTTTYDATIYLTNTELNAVAAGTLFILKTDAPTDATITTANSVELTPTLITGTNYVGFKGTFTGFSRFFLVDGPLCNTPPATITPSGPTTFCAGGNVILRANTGTYTYQWQKAGINISGATASSYLVTATGNYSVLVSQSGCTGHSSSVGVTVNTVSVSSISGPSAVCTGLNITLSDVTAGGVWSTASTAFATVSSSGVVSGLSAGTARISYSFTNSCGTAVATATVTVGAGAVVATISGTPNVCVGSNTTLSDATASGTWTTGNAAVASVLPGGVVTGVAAGTATISYNVTNISGCITHAITTVTVSAVPSVLVTPAGPVTICPGGNVVLNTSTGAGYSYQWQNASGDIAGATSSGYTATSGGNYTVVTHLGICSSTSVPVSVTVNTVTVTPIVGGNRVCVGQAILLTDATAGGAWNTSSTAVAAVTSSGRVTGVSGGIAVISYSFTNTCGTTVATATVTVTALPAVTPIAGVFATFCAGTTMSLSDATAGGIWSSRATAVATVNNSGLVAGIAAGSTTISYIVSNSCGADTATALVTVTSLPVAGTISGIDHVCPGYDVALSDNIAGGVWSSNVTAIATVTNAGVVYGINPGVDTIRYSVTNDCGTAIAKFAIQVDSVEICASSVGQIVAGQNDLKIFPNPNGGIFTINGVINDAADEKVTIIITDILGQVVYTAIAETHKGLLNTNIQLNGSIARGAYLVNVTSGKVHAVFHVVVDK